MGFIMDLSSNQVITGIIVIKFAASYKWLMTSFKWDTLWWTNIAMENHHF